MSLVLAVALLSTAPCTDTLQSAMATSVAAIHATDEFLRGRRSTLPPMPDYSLVLELDCDHAALREIVEPMAALVQELLPAAAALHRSEGPPDFTAIDAAWTRVEAALDGRAGWLKRESLPGWQAYRRLVERAPRDGWYWVALAHAYEPLHRLAPPLRSLEDARQRLQFARALEAGALDVPLPGFGTLRMEAALPRSRPAGPHCYAAQSEAARWIARQFETSFSHATDALRIRLATRKAAELLCEVPVSSDRLTVDLLAQIERGGLGGLTGALQSIDAAIAYRKPVAQRDSLEAATAVSVEDALCHAFAPTILRTATASLPQVARYLKGGAEVWRFAPSETVRCDREVLGAIEIQARVRSAYWALLARSGASPRVLAAEVQQAFGLLADRLAMPSATGLDAPPPFRLPPNRFASLETSCDPRGCAEITALRKAVPASDVASDFRCTWRVRPSSAESLRLTEAGATASFQTRCLAGRAVPLTLQIAAVDGEVRIESEAPFRVGGQAVTGAMRLPVAQLGVRTGEPVRVTLIPQTERQRFAVTLER